MYDYKDNMHVIDIILNELIIEKTICLRDDFENALSNIYLKLFPFESDDNHAAHVEQIFNDYIKDYNIKEWYKAYPEIPINKINNYEKNND